MAERLFTVYQVADLLGAGPAEILGWIDKKWLAYRRIGNDTLRISESNLIDFLKKRGVDIEKIMAKVVLAESRATHSPQPPSAPLPPPPSRLELKPALPDAPIAPEPTTTRPADESPAERPGEELPAGSPQAEEEPGAAEEDLPAEPAEEESPAETPSAESAATPLETPQIVEAILRDAVTRGASDIHLETSADGLSLRLRIDGLLHDKANFRLRLPRNLGPKLIAHCRHLAGMAPAARTLQEGRFSCHVEGRPVEFRLAACPTAHGEKLVLHVLDSESRPPTLAELGLAPADESLVRDLIAQPSGLIVLTGMPRSGVATTMRAIRSELLLGKVSVVAVGAGQEPAGDAATRILAGQGFPHSIADAVAAAAKLDADAILIDEMARPPAAQAALAAAKEGRLVLGRMHARSAGEAAALLLEMGLHPWDLASMLLAVIAQTTAVRLCSRCKRPAEVSPQTLERLGLRPADIDFTPQSAAGCAHCHHSGQSGRAGLLSILTVQGAVASALRNRADAAAIEAAGAATGMRTILQAGLDSARRGVISLDQLPRGLRGKG